MHTLIRTARSPRLPLTFLYTAAFIAPVLLLAGSWKEFRSDGTLTAFLTAGLLIAYTLHATGQILTPRRDRRSR